jgi:hypothetical protein
VSEARTISVMGAPRPDEAAAVAAAIERFRAETAPAGGDQREPIGPWQRAALVEGVSAKRSILQDSEGGSKWLS